MQQVIITCKFRYNRECRDGKRQHYIDLIILTIVTKYLGNITFFCSKLLAETEEHAQCLFQLTEQLRCPQ